MLLSAYSIIHTGSACSNLSPSTPPPFTLLDIMADTNRRAPTWETIAAKKRIDLINSIPAEWRVPDNVLPPSSQDDVTTWPATSGWFTPQELAITELGPGELLPQLISAKLKSEDVIKAFCKRASAAHQLVSRLRALISYHPQSIPSPKSSRSTAYQKPFLSEHSNRREPAMST